MCRMRPALFAIALTTAVVACSSPSSPSGSGSTLNIMLKDSPFSDAKALLVTFSEVSAHISGTGGFTPLPFSGSPAPTSRTCDLKKLAAATDILGTGSLTAGHYTQIRLTVSSAILDFDSPSSGAACQNSITPAGKNTANVTIPSGQVILNREFDVTSAGATTITVDFDGDQSVHAQGNGQYNMTPVISVVSVN